MNIVYPYGEATVSLAASDKIAVYSEDACKITALDGYPNVPSTESVVANVAASTLYQSAAVTAASTYKVYAGASPVVYEVGASADVKAIHQHAYQGDPVALNATGTVTAAMILGGIVTSTTAAAVAGTVDTGAIMDAASSWAIGDSVDWTVITTGANAFTVTASAGHTLVGNMVVAAGKAGLFRTRKTAADTFITYSLANT